MSADTYRRAASDARGQRSQWKRGPVIKSAQGCWDFCSCDAHSGGWRILACTLELNIRSEEEHLINVTDKCTSEANFLPHASAIGPTCLSPHHRPWGTDVSLCSRETPTQGNQVVHSAQGQSPLGPLCSWYSVPVPRVSLFQNTGGECMIQMISWQCASLKGEARSPEAKAEPCSSLTDCSLQPVNRRLRTATPVPFRAERNTVPTPSTVTVTMTTAKIQKVREEDIGYSFQE